MSSFPEITLNKLKESPVLAPGFQQIAYSDLEFDTPSGKIELYSKDAHEKWGISPLAEYTQVNNAQDKTRFPLEFITPNMGSRIHSQFGNLNIIKETNQEPVVRISPVDAGRRNICSGQKIKIYNQIGEFISRAEISNRVPTGLVAFPNGIWLNEGGGVNQLIAGEETDIGFGAAFHDNRVEIERVE
jgi:anaerobic selenocysteine-containing dehydrogenase